MIQGISLRVRTPGSGHSREGILTVWQHPPDLTASEMVLRLDSKSQSRQPTVTKTESWKLTSVAEGSKGYLGTRRNTTNVISVPWGSQRVCRFELPPYGKPFRIFSVLWSRITQLTTQRMPKRCLSLHFYYFSSWDSRWNHQSRYTGRCHSASRATVESSAVWTHSHSHHACVSGDPAFKASLWSQVFS